METRGTSSIFKKITLFDEIWSKKQNRQKHALNYYLLECQQKIKQKDTSNFQILSCTITPSRYLVTPYPKLTNQAAPIGRRAETMPVIIMNKIPTKDYLEKIEVKMEEIQQTEWKLEELKFKMRDQCFKWNTSKRKSRKI